MDISDIFDEPAPAAAVRRHPAAHLPAGLVAQAENTARAHDSAVSTQRIYDLTRERLLAEVDKKLEILKSEADIAAAKADEQMKALQAAMEAAQISEIPQLDRGPLHIKVYAGKKKSITKTYLETVLDKKKALAVWEGVERGPDERVLVVPPRYEDEPLT